MFMQLPIVAHAASLQWLKPHLDLYIASRSALGIDVPEVEDVSAGGMPNRVKCLHSLVAHSLAAGPDVNPLGDEALAKLPKWWQANPCE